MNILPKKRWHVRTKENIARVRKDEAEAAEKERQERLRTEQADREARLSVLKQKSKQKLQGLGLEEPDPKLKPEQKVPAEHINLFANYEDAVKTTNKEHDKELKEKNEEYEKKIGYLTYLGQDTNEALGKKNWYEVLPETSRFSRSSDIKDTYDKLVLKDEDGKPKIKEPDERNGEICWKKKQMLDPMNAFKHLHHSHKEKKNTKSASKIMTNDCVTTVKKHNKHKIKKHKKAKNDDDDEDVKKKKLQMLREARLKREQQEKYRTELFLTGLNKPTNTETEKDTRIKAKYNSQFNPELARQNYR